MSTQAESLTEIESQIANNIAITLVQENTDVNEFGKAIAYLRSIINQPDAGTRFFTYLKTLVNHGRQIGHSSKTLGYYRNIEHTCSKYLQNYQKNAHSMLKIMGWAMRLMRYYRVSPVEEMTVTEIPEQLSERQAEIAEVMESQTFAVDQILEAKVLGIKGNKVTYEILETIKLTMKEPKKADDLQEGEMVKVKITGLKDDGSVKNVKCV
ncbi:MAG: hypothetical protein KI793_24990 [Rivularia sp. (in: Bacteria)]|nr:hypothetical protein [Rivularia sp. MS3]